MLSDQPGEAPIFDLIIQVGLFVIVLPALLYLGMLVIGGLGALMGMAANGATRLSSARERARCAKLKKAAAHRESQLRLAAARPFINGAFPPALRRRGIAPAEFDMIIDNRALRAGVRHIATGRTTEVSVDLEDFPYVLFAHTLRMASDIYGVIFSPDHDISDLGDFEGFVQEVRQQS